MSRAREIYSNAVMASRKEHQRLCRQFIRGKIDICPCGMDMEREAIIKAFDGVFVALQEADLALAALNVFPESHPRPTLIKLLTSPPSPGSP